MTVARCRGAAPMPAFSPATLFSPRAEKYFLVEILVIGDRLTHALGVQTVSSRGQRTRGGQLHVPLSYFQKYFRTKVLSKYFRTKVLSKYLFVQYVYVVLHVYSGTHKQLLYTRTTIHELAYTYTFIGPTVTTNVQYHTSEGSFLSVFCTSGRKYGNRYLRTFVYVYCTLLTTYLFIRPSKVIRRY